MSLQECASVALARWGGRTIVGVDLPTVMVAIAGAETGGTWRDDAEGDAFGGQYSCHGYVSEGLWQIEMAAHYPYLRSQTGSSDPCVWAEWLWIPAHCAAAADYVIGNTAKDLPLWALHPWTTWWAAVENGAIVNLGNGKGAYLGYMDQARAAIDAITGSPTLPPPTPSPSPTPTPTPSSGHTLPPPTQPAAQVAPVSGWTVGLAVLLVAGPPAVYLGLRTPGGQRLVSSARSWLGGLHPSAVSLHR